MSTKIGFLGIQAPAREEGGLVSPWPKRHKQAMRLTINGETRELDGIGDVAGLVSGLGLDPRKVAVERNLEIVPRSLYGATAIAEGDRIEIVHFIGGG